MAEQERMTEEELAQMGKHEKAHLPYGDMRWSDSAVSRLLREVCASWAGVGTQTEEIAVLKEELEKVKALSVARGKWIKRHQFFYRFNYKAHASVEVCRGCEHGRFEGCADDCALDALLPEREEKPVPLTLDETVELLGAEAPEDIGPLPLNPLGMHIHATKMAERLKQGEQTDPRCASCGCEIATSMYDYVKNAQFLCPDCFDEDVPECV